MEPSRAKGESTFRIRPYSMAAAAQLLELWVQRRAVLDRAEVEHCLSRMQDLDMAVGDLYEDLFVNISVTDPG